MKKLLVTVIAMLTVMSVSAKDEDKSTFGIKGGVGLTSITNIDQGKMKFGYKVGLTGDAVLLPILSIQPSLYFTGKGYEQKWSTSNNNASITLTANANYVELPILVMFNIPFSDNFKISAGLGPYFAYGVAGKTKVKGNVGGLEANTDWNTFDGGEIVGIQTVSAMKRFDWGLSASIGLKVSSLVLSLNYDLGLQDVYKGETLSEDNKDKTNLNSNLWLGVAIVF